MPYIDMSKNLEAVSMLQTFRMNYEGYTKKEIEADILAHKLQARVGHTSDADFKTWCVTNSWKNTPSNSITPLAQIIYLSQTSHY